MRGQWTVITTSTPGFDQQLVVEIKTFKERGDELLPTTIIGTFQPIILEGRSETGGQVKSAMARKVR